MSRSRFLATFLGAAAFALSSASAEPPSENDLRFFRDRIEPVLKANCYACHSGQAKEIKGGLRLDSRPSVLLGGDSGAAVVPGKPEESLLIQAIRHDGLEMPPEKPRLAAAVIADFVKWIEQGAPDPREGETPIAGNPDAPAARAHWAFQPVRRMPLPSVRDVTRPRNAIDAFVLAKLKERHWPPSPTASRGELIRRLSFDFTGLPPSPDEVAAFATDETADAYERLVDRLIASPRFGERQAQGWLDVVRYAESEGYEYDRHVPDAWRFRDYVIDSFNGDKPYDQFVREQIAGDELSPQDHELLSASIFHRLGPVRRNAGNPEIALSRNEVLTERTDIIGTAFLGLTIGCARCHNHKLEPITQKDYYRLQAYLAATEEHNVSLASSAEQEAWDAETKRIKEQMDAIKQVARLATGEERVQMQSQIDALEATLPAPLATIPATANDFAKRTQIHVLKRGMWEQKLDAVGPRPPSVLVSHETGELPADVSNPRTQLADWIASSVDPLTSRVMVNRLWQHHFGTGLVKSANDFGLHGEVPSHGELLDWLAAELVAGQWELKRQHRRMVSSAAYRQQVQSLKSKVQSQEANPKSEIPNPQSAIRNPQSIDPDNRLLWHFPRRRLSAEELRDAMLAVSGRINLAAGGASVMVPVDKELVDLLYKPSQWQVAANAAQHHRRSIYLIAKRNLRLPFMEAFDAPPTLTSCSRRESSTHAPQALELLNGKLAGELAAAFALRLKRECGDDRERIVSRAYELALGREPTARERQLSLDFLRDQPLSEFALAIFNLNEFAYVP
ncbi:MAG TPA: PSD1 and planctomycete cytochrome C domain-containing protein [Pirellulaceae bacterium]|nr:PSD1 and planctomycete cytochrome C domain-containing protein [Pirellulaceae bacterium]